MTDKPNIIHTGERRKLTITRSGKTKRVIIDGKNIYFTANTYEDGTLGEIFIDIGKEGEISSVYDMAAIAISIGLQYGIPLDVFVDKYEFQKTEDGGITSDLDFPIVSSVMDWVAKRLRKDFLFR